MVTVFMDPTFCQLCIDKGYLIYDGLFVHDLKYHFNFYKKDGYVTFTNKPIILYNPKLKEFVDQALVEIHYDYEHNNINPRHIVVTKSDPTILNFIKNAKMDYWTDSQDRIFIHQSDLTFIEKYSSSSFTKEQIRRKFWSKRWLYKKTSNQFDNEVCHLYIFNLTDKVFLHQHVAANLVNQFKVNFYLGHNQDIVINNNQVSLLTRNFLSLNLDVISSHSKMFYALDKI